MGGPFLFPPNLLRRVFYCRTDWEYPVAAAFLFEIPMPSFGTASAAELITCHPDLQLLFSVVVEKFDCSVICGHRDETAQQEAFDSGNSKVQYPNSEHNSYPSMAADVAPYPYNGDDEKRFYFFAGQVMAIAAMLYEQELMNHRVRWGGDWDGDTEVNDQTFNDLAHFELITDE